MLRVGRQVLGPLPEGRCYCLKIPAALGREYVARNLATIAHEELVRFSGYLANEVEELPDGTEVRLRVGS